MTVRLAPLSVDDVDELIPGTVSGRLRARIARAAGGNPLFIQEMLAVAESTEGEVVVPPTLQAVLATRLDQLEPEERSVLERGAVEGEIFHHGAVQALAPDETQVTSRLAALVRKGLIRPDQTSLVGEEGFRFHHLLIRDAAYNAIPKALRAGLHERFAAWLELRASELAAELDQLLGHHLEQAYRYRAELGASDDETRALGQRAASRLAAAGVRASARGDLGAAATLLGRAAALFPLESRERIEAVLTLVEPFVALMRVEEVGAFLDQAGRTAELLGDEHLAARVNVEKAWVVVAATAERWSERAVLSQVEAATAVFERLGDDAAQARALEVVATVHLYFGRLSAVAATSERGSNYAESARHVKLQGKHRLGREVADLWDTTPFDQVDRRLEQDLAWARETGSLGVEACATVSTLAWVRALRGDRTGGNELFARGLSFCVELGTWGLGPPGRLGFGPPALTDDLGLSGGGRLGESYEMLTRSREARDGFGPSPRSSRPPTACTARGATRGAADEQANLRRSPRASAPGRRRRYCTIHLHASGPSAALCPPRKPGRRRGHGTAKGVAPRRRDRVSVHLRGESLLALAGGLLLALAGRTDEAAEPLRQALALWEAKGNVIDAGRGRARSSPSSEVRLPPLRAGVHAAVCVVVIGPQHSGRQ